MKRNSILIPVLIIVLLFFLFFILPRIIKIFDFDCENQDSQCSDSLMDELELIKNLNLVQSKSKAEQILRDTYVKDYSLHYKFPGKLEIRVIENRPKYALRIAPSFILVSEDGLVLGISDTTNLPYITKDSALPKKGDKISKEELYALELVFDISQIFEMKEAFIENDSLHIVLKEGILVILPLDKDKELLVGSLVLLMKEIKEEGEFNTIDLRFENPILK